MPVIAPDTPLHAFFVAVPCDEDAHIKDVRSKVRDLRQQGDLNEAVLKQMLDKIPYVGMERVNPAEWEDEDNYVSLAWPVEQDIANIRLLSRPDFEQSRVQTQVSSLRQAASAVRANKRPKSSAVVSETLDAANDTPPSRASMGDSDSIPALSSSSTSGTSRTSKLEGVRKCDRALVATWKDRGQIWRNMMAVEEWKIAAPSNKDLGMVLGGDTAYFAPDKCQIGHAQGLTYLVSANEMGGTFLLRIINGTKFRRAVMLPGNIIVVEDADPTRDTDSGPIIREDNPDPDRTPTKSTQRATGSLESQLSDVSVKAFIHDFAIESRMPWDLDEAQAGHRAGTAPGRSALVYADFMYQAARLATNRDVEHAAARRLPDPTIEQCLKYVEIISIAPKIAVTDGSIRDLLIYARWDKLSTLIEDHKVRRSSVATRSARTPHVPTPPAPPTDSTFSPSGTTLAVDDLKSRQSETESDGNQGPRRRKRPLLTPQGAGFTGEPRRDEDDDDPGGGPSGRSGVGPVGDTGITYQGPEGTSSTKNSNDSSAVTKSGGHGSQKVAAFCSHEAAAVLAVSDASEIADHDCRRSDPLAQGSCHHSVACDTDERQILPDAVPAHPSPLALWSALDDEHRAVSNQAGDQSSRSPDRKPTPSRQLHALVEQGSDFDHCAALSPLREVLLNHVGSWLSETSGIFQSSDHDLSDGDAVRTDVDELELDGQASSLLTSSDETHRRTLPTQGQLVDQLEAAGVRIWRTFPQALTKLIACMVDDSVRNVNTSVHA